MDSEQHLFTPFRLRDVEFHNRIVTSPMCQYSSPDGFATDWHLVHLGSRAVGGASLVFTEACAVSPEGRITAQDLGIWKDAHLEQLGRIARFLQDNGAVPGIQLAHAGRKASTRAPWEGGKTVPVSEGGWRPVAPSAVAFSEDDEAPHALTVNEIHKVCDGFVSAAKRALRAGFQVAELHAAHGYLFHEFLSPLSNKRTDEYGGSFENRIRLLLEVTGAVRTVWPETLPLFVRISATDWISGGWDIEQSVELSRRLKTLGVDLMDVSSGGLAHGAQIPLEPGYQTPFAERIKKEAGIQTGAVGLITEAKQADAIVREGRADLVLLARAELRDPYWPLNAARELGVKKPAPVQYQRAY